MGTKIKRRLRQRLEITNTKTLIMQEGKLVLTMKDRDKSIQKNIYEDSSVSSMPSLFFEVKQEASMRILSIKFQSGNPKELPLEKMLLNVVSAINRVHKVEKAVFYFDDKNTIEVSIR